MSGSNACVRDMTEKRFVWNVSFMSLSETVVLFVTNKFPVKRTPALFTKISNLLYFSEI